MSKLALILTTIALASQAASLSVTLPIQKRDASAGGAFRKRAVANVPLGGADTSYFVSLGVGTPPVDFLVVLDTGSSDLVLETAVQSDSCGGCVTTGPLYNASASTISNATTIPIVLQYGIGEDSGVLVTDVVSLAGLKTNQPFAACNINDQFSAIGDSTGLLGLAWPTIAQTHSTPFIQGLYESGQLDEPLFSLAFGQSGTGVGLEGAGYLTIGGTNSSLYSGALNYFDANNTLGYWGFELETISVGGQALDLPANFAILDSGTNSLTFPEDVVGTIYAAIPGSKNTTQGWTYPCSTNVSIAFTINGTSYAVNPTDFNNGNIDKTTCAGAVIAGGDDSWIIGSTFMLSYYSVFRWDPPSIGLAAIADPNKILESASVSGFATATGTSPASASTSKSAASTLHPLQAVCFTVVALLFASIM